MIKNIISFAISQIVPNGPSVVAQLPEAVKAGRSVKIKTRDCEVELENEDKLENEREEQVD